jgi:hypothetical protein
MNEIQDTTIEDKLARKWFIRSAKGQHGYVAWSKLTLCIADDPIREKGNVWFQIKKTRDEAIQKIKQELNSELWCNDE